MPSQTQPTRRQVLKGALAATAATALGCGRSRERTGGRVTLDFYTYSNPEWRDLFGRRLIPAFERDHPGIKIRFNEAFGEMYDGKLLTLIAGKVAPDIFHVTQSNFPAYAAKAVPLELDEFLENDKSFDLKEIYPKLTDGMRYRGKLLGLPSDFSTIVMLYNQRLFDRYKIDPPQQGWTWQDYLETARRLTIDRPEGKIWGCANQPQYNRWPAWVWMAGGDIFDANVTRCTMDSPESIEGFSFYANLSLKEKVAARPDLMEQEYYQSLFTAGRLGMIADSRYIYKRFLRVRKLDFPWDLVPMPRGPKAQATTFIWGGNCIYKGTKHPKECWDFLKFITGPEGAQVTLDGGNALPPYRPAAEAEMKHPRAADIPPNDKLFLDALTYAQQAPFPRQYPEFTNSQSVLNECFLGPELGTPEQACREFAKKVNQFLTADVF